MTAAAAERTGASWTHPVVIAAATALVTAGTPPTIKAVGEALAPPAKQNLLPETIAPLQDAKWDANPTCGVAQNLWHPKSDNAQIDATICPVTGDILVSVKDYRGRVTQYWPTLAPVVTTSKVAVNTLFASPAAAAVPPAFPAPVRARLGVELAQDVTCQVRLDASHVKRRLRRPDGTCVDVVIDTATGQTVSSVPIPCSAAC